MAAAAAAAAMAALQRVAQSSISTTASSYGSCKGAGASSSSVAVASDMAVPDQFPAGLRVLVVDDDNTCLKIVEQMLRRCLYRGNSCSFFFFVVVCFLIWAVIVYSF